MITFNDFVKKFNLKNKATSNIKIQQVLSSLSLNDVDIEDMIHLNLILVLLIYTHRKALIGFVTLTKIILINMDVFVHRNYLNL